MMFRSNLSAGPGGIAALGRPTPCPTRLAKPRSVWPGFRPGVLAGPRTNAFNKNYISIVTGHSKLYGSKYN